jgi:hypothetical protein
MDHLCQLLTFISLFNNHFIFEKLDLLNFLNP